MSSTAIPLSTLATTGHWQTDFANVLPQIQKHARIRFRHLRPSDQEEACAESVAAAAVMFEQLAREKKLGQAYPSSLASFATRHVALGRHVGGRQSIRDVLSTRAQQKRGFGVLSLQAPTQAGGCLATVQENHRVSPADLAAFKLDFQAWLKGFTRRQRRVINRLAAGDCPSEVASKVKLSRGRVSQMRREFEQSWRVFQGERAGEEAA